MATTPYQSPTQRQSTQAYNQNVNPWTNAAGIARDTNGGWAPVRGSGVQGTPTPGWQNTGDKDPKNDAYAFSPQQAQQFASGMPSAQDFQNNPSLQQAYNADGSARQYHFDQASGTGWYTDSVPANGQWLYDNVYVEGSNTVKDVLAGLYGMGGSGGRGGVQMPGNVLPPVLGAGANGTNGGGSNGTNGSGGNWDWGGGAPGSGGITLPDIGGLGQYLPGQLPANQLPPLGTLEGAYPGGIGDILGGLGLGDMNVGDYGPDSTLGLGLAGMLMQHVPGPGSGEPTPTPGLREYNTGITAGQIPAGELNSLRSLLGGMGGAPATPGVSAGQADALAGLYQQAGANSLGGARMGLDRTMAEGLSGLENSRMQAMADAGLEGQRFGIERELADLQGYNRRADQNSALQQSAIAMLFSSLGGL